MDELNKLLEKTDDPRIRRSLQAAFRMGVDAGSMITQYAINDGFIIAKDGYLTGSFLAQSGLTKNAD